MSATPGDISVRERVTALSQLVGSMICLQFGSSTAKSLFPVFGAVGMVGLRTSFAAVILVCVYRSWNVMSWRALRVVFPYGLATAAMNICFYLALERIPLGMTVAIEFTGPLLLAFIGSRRLSDVGWLAVTIGGLALLLKPSSSTPPDPLGVLFAIGAALFWGLYIVFGRRLTGKLPAGNASALGLVCGSIVLFIPSFLPAMATGVMQPSMLALSVIVAICSSALPYALEMQAMHRLSARDLGVLYSLEPVCAALAGVFVLHETLSVSRICGVLLIATASVGTVLTPSKKPSLSDVPEAPQ
ncbi:transporter [Acetobacter senegalensis]|uniref:Transporter n=2 Tax=Acetobacter TaxID=434 RepID=A0A252EIX3_9PROT|nr:MULTISPECIES: EamA family transporter [Acetobacter]ATJ91054.1 EamA family transporter [Acetobacter tropicalis]OUL66203.1 transporter [Acetobacter senegalensis]